MPPPGYCPTYDRNERGLILHLSHLKDLFFDYPDASVYIKLKEHGNDLSKLLQIGLYITGDKTYEDKAFVKNGDLYEFLGQNCSAFQKKLRNLPNSNTLDYDAVSEMASDLAISLKRDVTLCYESADGSGLVKHLFRH